MNDNPQLFYKDESDLLDKLTAAVKDIPQMQQNHYQKIAEKYDWSNMIKEYDEEFEKHVISIV